MVAVTGLTGPSRRGSLIDAGLSLLLLSLLFLSLSLLSVALEEEVEEEEEELSLVVFVSSSFFDHV